MSDARDALAKAVVLNKRLAATRLVRKEELEAELSQVKAERADVAGDRPELEAKIQELTTEIEVVTSEYRAALAEVVELQKLARSAGSPAAVDTRIGERDPLLPSLEESALDAARRHVRELAIRAGLDDELGAAAARTGAPSREEADARARAELAELRARRALAAGDDPDGPASLPKTL